MATCTTLFLALACLTFAAPTLAVPSNPFVKCPVTLEGRVSLNTTLETFDTPASLFNPDYTKGQNLSWSQILQFPDTKPSRFDLPSHKALEVTIDDRSLFVPGGGKAQLGFRRAGLLMGNGSDASNVGVQTFHWSSKQVGGAKGSHAMNLTHEYMTVWHEANDYASNQFSINAGVMLSQDNPKEEGKPDSTKLDKRLWKVLDRKNNVIWTGRIKYGVWQNFAITMDIEKKWVFLFSRIRPRHTDDLWTLCSTLRVYYSEGYDRLKAVTPPVANDNSGGGQYQIGILKKPTETTSVVNDGYQESGIHEGQVYGGIFIENSSNNCFSL